MDRGKSVFYYSGYEKYHPDRKRGFSAQRAGIIGRMSQKTLFGVIVIGLLAGLGIYLYRQFRPASAREMTFGPI